MLLFVATTADKYAPSHNHLNQESALAFVSSDGVYLRKAQSGVRI